MDLGTVVQFLQTIQSENTRRAYSIDLQGFERWLYAHCEHLSELTVRLMDEYRNGLTQSYASATVNRKLAAVRAYITWLIRLELIEPRVKALADAVPGVKVREKLPRLLTDDELSRLLETPDRSDPLGRRDSALLRLLATAGLRVSEAEALNVEDLDLEGRTAFISDAKGGSDRMVPLSRKTVELLRECIDTDGPVFQNHRGGRLTARSIETLVKAYGAAVGRPDLHPHLLRHQQATALLNATGEDRIVGDILGHKDLRTTRRYTRLAVKRHLSAIDTAFE